VKCVPASLARNEIGRALGSRDDASGCVELPHPELVLYLVDAVKVPLLAVGLAVPPRRPHREATADQGHAYEHKLAGYELPEGDAVSRDEEHDATLRRGPDGAPAANPAAGAPSARTRATRPPSPMQAMRHASARALMLERPRPRAASNTLWWWTLPWLVSSARGSEPLPP
jgi:hypothetical protein